MVESAGNGKSGPAACSTPSGRISILALGLPIALEPNQTGHPLGFRALPRDHPSAFAGLPGAVVRWCYRQIPGTPVRKQPASEDRAVCVCRAAKLDWIGAASTDPKWRISG